MYPYIKALALICAVLAFLRVYMFYKAVKPTAGPGRVLANQVARNYSIRYFLPISYKKLTKGDVDRAKKANLILYALYIAFAALLISILVSY
jgi:hypothetical protein